MLDRLRDNIDSDKTVGAIFPTYEGRHALIGIVKENRFRVFLRSTGLRDVAGDFQGEIFEGTSGSRIDGRFLDAENRLLLMSDVGIVRVFMAKISAFWTCSLCFGLWCWWIVREAQANETFPLIAFTPISLLVLLYAWRTLRRRNQGQQLLLKELARIVIAEPSNTHSVRSATDYAPSKFTNHSNQLLNPWRRIDAPGNSRS